MTSPGDERSGAGRMSPFRFVGLGFEIVVPLIIGLFLGHRLDVWFGTRPWFLLAGTLLGMVAGFVNFFWSVLPHGEGRGRGEQ